MFHRILKLMAAYVATQGINVVTQLLVPAFFIRNYGVPVYGEWLALSAAVSSLSTLNFGITTYVSNELTMLYQRKEMESYRRLQASSLRLLLGILAGALLVLPVVSLIPITRLLHLQISQRDASLVVIFLGASVIVGIGQAHLTTMFMVVSRMHRGSSWATFQAALRTGILLLLIGLHSSFVVLAFGTLLSGLLVLLPCFLDFCRIAPDIKPSLHPFDWPTAKSTLTPSGMFAILFLQNVLAFQVPVLVIQTVLGGSAVVVFSISRTLFAMVRQIISAIGGTIGPEITRTYGARDWPALLRIYHNSEKIVFTLVVVGNLGALVISPVLLKVWLHKPQLFAMVAYGLMALTSAAMSMKEHKFSYQYYTNEHHQLAVVSFISYLLMSVIGYPLTRLLGVNGFVLAWLAAEVSQIFLIYRLNRKLFIGHESIVPYPVYKLFAILFFGVPVCAWFAKLGTAWSSPGLLCVGLLCMSSLFAICYQVFQMQEIGSEIAGRIAGLRRAGARSA
jgi:O-antigen/teichoic acid export membrane protein